MSEATCALAKYILWVCFPNSELRLTLSLLQKVKQTIVVNALWIVLVDQIEDWIKLAFQKNCWCNRDNFFLIQINS